MANTPILGLPQVSPTQAQKELTINDAIVALEGATNGNLLVSYAAALTKTLSELQFTRSFLFTAGVTTADAILQVPATIAGAPSKRLFCVRNKTNYGLTVRSASGTGTSISIPNGEARLLCIADDNVFVAAQPSTPVSFLALGETPDTYAGKAGQFLKVAAGEDGLVFVALTTTIDNFDDVDLTGQTDGKVLVRTGGVWKPGTFPAGVTTFLGLSDVPDAYGAAGTFCRVNGTGNGVEFIAINQVPAGTGTAGQVLTKGAGTAYTWADPATGAVPNGGTTGQVLTKKSATDGDTEWDSPAAVGVPAGGATGQVLKKVSGTDYDTAWAAPTPLTESFVIAVSDEATALTVGTSKMTFRMPYAFTLTGVRASLTVASSAGIPTVDINENTVSILSTKLTIDANERTSTTAAIPVVISDAALADDAEITIDIDVAGTGASGLKVYLIGHR